MKYVVYNETVFFVSDIDRRGCNLQNTQVIPHGTKILFFILYKLLFRRLRGFKCA